MLSFRSLVSRAPRSAPSLGFRAISTSPLLRSAAGYGDDPTEGASNSGTKTPANSKNPTPKGSTGGKTDPEVKPKSGGSGGSGNKAKTTTGGSGDSGSTTGDKQPGGPEVSHSEGKSVSRSWNAKSG